MNAVSRVNGTTEAAAFFDIDGTIMALPSLERRFFRVLRYRRAIRPGNYLAWLAEAMRLAPRGVTAMLQANKAYLRGVRTETSNEGGVLPRFFVQAWQRLAWHAKEGHNIVLMSGTLEPLAYLVARTIEKELGGWGVAAKVQVCATRLEKANDKWTGKILGKAVCGEEKARVVQRVAQEMGWDLAKCYAYGDKASDRWMLATVGRQTAVNPSGDLARVAYMYGWEIAEWRKDSERKSGTRGSIASITRGQGIERSAKGRADTKHARRVSANAAERRG